MKYRVAPACAFVLAFLLLGARHAAVSSGVPQDTDGPRYSAWSQPVNLGAAVNSATGDFFPSISKDGLSLYFTSLSCPSAAGCRTQGVGGYDIYFCRRDTTDDPWGPAEALPPPVNSPYDDVDPFLTIDGHHLLFASNRPGGFGGNDIYVSRRQDKLDDSGWEAPENLGSGVNTSVNEANPALFADDNSGQTFLYFDANRPEGPGPYGPDDAVHNGNDIWVSILQPDETFGPATLVPELSTPQADRHPSIRRDGLEMYLTSNRPGGRIGTLDIWVSTRTNTSEPWGTPANAGPVINGVGQNAGATLWFGATELYFQAGPGSRPGFGGYDLFVATRVRLTGAPQYP